MAASETVALNAAASADDLSQGARTLRRRAAWAPVAVGLLVAVGLVLRAIVAHQSVFADELSTDWISVPHGLGGVLSLLYSTGRIQHAEITPPLSFLASWLSTRPGATVELLRAPALLAGTATIPLMYALGLRTVGRRAALLATAVTALSPFMIYYSAEARAYGLMMFLLTSSTLSMLLAIDTRRRRYWALYAVFAAAALCTHYTSSFVLFIQLAWVLWAHPRERRRALTATAAAAALVIPWLPGLLGDLRSPTVTILSALSPFTATAVRVDIQHWALGYPYSSAGGLADLPGVPSLLLLAVVFVVAAAGLAVSVRRGGWHEPLRSVSPAVGRIAGPPRPGSRIVLVVVLMLATPAGEIAGSALGSHVIGVRDLAASWPFLALSAAAFVTAAGRRAGAFAAALTVVAFMLAAPKMLEARFARPNYQAAADDVAAHARAGDVVVDETGGLSPGPLTGFDVSFHRRLTVIRALAPAERDHPFTVYDPFVSLPTAFTRAVAAAHGGRIYVVSVHVPGAATPPDLAPAQLPAGYRRRSQRVYTGIESTLVSVYSRSSAAAP